MIKKIFGLLVIFFTLSSAAVLGAYNPADNPMTVIPNSDIFKGGGDTFPKEVFQEWINAGLCENSAYGVLDGNYAFVINQENWWSIDHKEDFGKNTAIQAADGTFSIASELAAKAFGIKTSAEWITTDEIMKKSDKWEAFIDPRGFCVFSTRLSETIDKTPVSLEKYNGQDAIQYSSYYAVSLAIGEITWDDVEATDKDFDEYIKNWENTLLQLENLDKHEDYLQWLFGDVRAYMKLFDENASMGFSDTTLARTGAIRCRYFAEAYRSLVYLDRNDIDREELKSEIFIILEQVYQNFFSVNGVILQPTDGWFDTKITVPYYMADILMLMRDEIPKDKWQKYVNAGLIATIEPCISRFSIPPKSAVIKKDMQSLINPNNNYTNFLWCSHASIRFSVLAKDSYRMNRYFKYLCSIFEQNINSGNYNISTIRDGVFDDGTFKFHNWFFYNLGYGNSYAEEVAELLVTTANTAFDIRKLYNYDKLYDWIENAWVPFVYNGDMLKIAQGRENPAENNGLSILTASMIIASYAPEGIRENLFRAIKPAIGDRMSYYRDIPARIPGYYSFPFCTVQENINDAVEYIDSVGDYQPTYSKIYYNGDKVVHKKDDFTFMLSMSSERIGRYEAINQQSYDDWYIGSGMTYILTDDKQFASDWWFAVDRYRIPGTTVDGMEQIANSEYGLGAPENAWAGGATDGNISVAAMQLPGNWRWADTKLVGNKSYFMLDDKIVCLGSDISGGQGDVVTILDNIMLSRTDENGVVGVEDTYVGDKVVKQEFDSKEIFENPKYIWYEENRGYVLLGDNSVSAERVKSTKKYSGVLTTNTPNDIPFMTLMIEHGDSKKTADYGYVILPSATRKETAAYSENLDFDILEKNSTAHVIKLRESGIIMANIFKPTELEGFKFVTPCAVILEPEGSGYKVFLSEPTQRVRYVKIELPEDKAVTDNTSKIEKKGKLISIKVDDHYGKTYSFNYNLSGGGTVLNSDNIKVHNMRIRVSEKKISTKLYAESKDGDSLTYSISKNPENGTVRIVGERLEYIPARVSGYTDETVIAVKNSRNECSEYRIVFEK